ncbi:MAG TPA: DUF5666 domain-containing protein, partial [archaeon]|nr:DUF5666 domain-containing protein [archaeon]
MSFRKSFGISILSCLVPLLLTVSGLRAQNVVSFKGKVIQNDGKSVQIEITDASGNLKTLTINTDNSTRVNLPDGSVIALANIPLNNWIEGQGTVDSSTGKILASAIKDLGSNPPPPSDDQPPQPPPPGPTGPMPFGGKITEMGTDYIVIEWYRPETGESGQDKIFIDANTSIKDEAGNPATLVLGDFVDGEAEVQSDGSLKAISIMVRSNVPPGPGPAPAG